MMYHLRSNIMFLFPQLFLLLVVRSDYALSFGFNRHPTAENIRRSHHVESFGTFSRQIGMKTASKSFDRGFKGTEIVPRMNHRTGLRLNAVMDIVGVSPEPIHTAFAFATFGPQPFWLLMILLPGQEITKKTMGKMGKNMLHNAAHSDHLVHVQNSVEL